MINLHKHILLHWQTHTWRNPRKLLVPHKHGYVYIQILLQVSLVACHQLQTQSMVTVRLQENDHNLFLVDEASNLHQNVMWQQSFESKYLKPFTRSAKKVSFLPTVFKCTTYAKHRPTAPHKYIHSYTIVKSFKLIG